MTKQEYEHAEITACYWSDLTTPSHLTILLNGMYKSWWLNELLIPMFKCGFIEGFRDGMLVVQKIDSPSETEKVDVDAFMTQNIDMAFCEAILKHL